MNTKNSFMKSAVMKSWFKPGNWFFWFLLALLIKSIFFILKISEEVPPNKLYPHTFAIELGDTFSYIEPIENLIRTGVYFDDFRMPGYGWLYYLLRGFFEQGMALNAMVVLQLLFSALSVYLLAQIALKIFKKPAFFYLTFGLYSLSTFTSLYDNGLLTESFATSGLILVVYFYLTSRRFNYLYIGLLLTWIIFMKPVTLPILFLFVFLLIRKNWNNKRQMAISIFVLLFPFMVIDGYWTIRNYGLYQRIIPLTKSLNYPSVENSYRADLYLFMNSFGGSCVYWEPGAEITFFIKQTDGILKEEVSLPNEIYTSEFNYDSLVHVRELITTIEANKLSEPEKNILEKEISSKLIRYTQSVKKEKPFLYYVKSRITYFKTFYFHSGTYNLFFKPSFELNGLQYLIKIGYSLLYCCIVLFGFLGSFILFFKSKKSNHYLLISGIGLYFALVYPLVLKMDEYRYFVPAYPFFLISTVYFLLTIINRFFRKKKEGPNPISED